MDPLAAQLGCPCVPGYAQRDYEALAGFLSRRLGRDVRLRYAESLLQPAGYADKGVPDLVVGKFSEVASDASRTGLSLRPVALLTGGDGRVTQQGLFVVRADAPATSLGDLAGKRLILGPSESLEKSDAALASLAAYGVALRARPKRMETCNAAALAIAEGDADAAVISSYALPLLEGCGNIEKGLLRVVATTDEVPFIAAFAPEDMPAARLQMLRDALRAVGSRKRLLRRMESTSGFLPLDRMTDAWPDWRGAGRAATVSDLLEGLPGRPQKLWSRTLTGPGMAGPAVARGRVVVADKNLANDTDIFRCLDADTGAQRWAVRLRATGDMDFTNTPRANPVIHAGNVYLLNAFGTLLCLRFDDGRERWRRDLLKDFAGELPTWGTCSTPLVAGNRLIVNPGAPDASLAALDLDTGETLWTSPGGPPGYAAFIVARLGGVQQIVGYDAVTLGGWDPVSGERLWHLTPDLEGDFNVATPVVVGGQLLVATENNGTRLYAFDTGGMIVAEPVAQSMELCPDTSTPVAVGSRILGSDGRVVCLDRAAGLASVWQSDASPFDGYTSFIAGDGRALAMTQSGWLVLFDLAAKKPRELGRAHLFPEQADEERDVWGHPALVNNRLYVRNMLGISCFLIAE